MNMYRTLQRISAGLVILIASASPAIAQQTFERKVEHSGDGNQSQTKVMSANDVFFIGGVGAVIMSRDGGLHVDMMPDANNRDPEYRDVDLREGDIIMMVNGKRTKSVQKIRELFDQVEAAGEITLAIRRGNEMSMVSFPKTDNNAGGGRVMIMTQEVSPGEEGEDGPSVVTTTRMAGPGGMTQSVYPLMSFGVILADREDKVVVLPKPQVEGMTSKPIDLEEGDAITSINEASVSSIAEFGAVYDALPKGEPVALSVMRDGKEVKVSFVKPAANPKVQMHRKSQ